MKEHDYASALKMLEVGAITAPLGNNNALLAIHHALRFAEKMMGEPSEGMADAAYGTKMSDTYINDLFKAMRDQALKELGE